MMSKAASTLFLATAAGFIGSVVAVPENVFMQCNAYRLPNYDDCETIVREFNFKDSDKVVHTNGEEYDAPSCMTWSYGNCRIHQCFTKGNDARAPYKVTGKDIYDWYHQIRGDCVNWRAGGYYQNPFLPYTVEVYNDEDQVSGGRVKGGLEKVSMTLAEHEARIARTSSDSERVSNQITKRSFSDHIGKREEAMAVNLMAIGVRNPDAVEQGPRLAKGVGYTYDTSSSSTYGVSTSTELGGSWEFFSASFGVTTSQEETYSVSQSLTFDVDCDQRGQVTFYPYYDYYDISMVHESGSGEEPMKEHAWVPVVTGDKVSGDIAIACLG